MKHLVTKLSWVAKKILDVYNPQKYTRVEVFVPKPTMEAPYPCLLVSIRNGHSKLFFRVNDLASYYDFFRLSVEEEARLRVGLERATAEADRLEEDAKLLFQRRHLPEGAQWVRTDTGEVIAEAERILRGTQSFPNGKGGG